MSVGADSTIAPLFAVGIAHFAPAGSTDYVALIGLLAVSVGAIVALVGVLRLGWIAEFLSAPIITGFMAGVAVIIVIHQLPDLFGVASVSGSNLHRVSAVLQELSSTNGWALGIGVAVFCIVVGAEKISKKFPGALVGLVASTILVAALSLKNHGVTVLGAVARGSASWTRTPLVVLARRGVTDRRCRRSRRDQPIRRHIEGFRRRRPLRHGYQSGLHRRRRWQCLRRFDRCLSRQCESRSHRSRRVCGWQDPGRRSRRSGGAHLVDTGSGSLKGRSACDTRSCSDLCRDTLSSTYATSWQSRNSTSSSSVLRSSRC